MITKKSQFNVADTLDRLESILHEKGIKPIARVDHSAAAKKIDLDLRPTEVLFFGNPALGTPLMQANQIAGLDLPMRVLAWEAEDGATWVCYHAPKSMFENLGIDDDSGSVQKMTAVLDALTNQATKL